MLSVTFSLTVDIFKTFLSPVKYIDKSVTQPIRATMTQVSRKIINLHSPNEI